MDNTSLNTGFGPMTNKIINELIGSIDIDNHRDKIYDKVVDPLTGIVQKRMLPYLYFSAGLYILIIVLLLIIIYILHNKKC